MDISDAFVEAASEELDQEEQSDLETWLNEIIVASREEQGDNLAFTMGLTAFRAGMVYQRSQEDAQTVDVPMDVQTLLAFAQYLAQR